MKSINILFTILVMFFSANSWGAQIVDGTYDKDSDTILIDVVYQGGCKVHEFEIKLNLCNRALPMSCSAELVDHTQGDVCRGFMTETVRIPADSLVGGYNIDKLYIKGQSESSVVIDF